MTKQAEEILSQKRSLESELEALESSNEPEQYLSEIRTLQNEIEQTDICEYCEGEGEVINHSRINHTTTDIPYKTCPSCRGTGIKN